jgi:flagellar basal body-associated protein FliL
MAWEEENIDAGLNLEEVSGRKRPLKLILFALVGLLVLGGGGYAVWLFFMKPKPANEATAEEGKEGEAGKSEGAAEGEKQGATPDPANANAGFKVDLDRFILNLADREEPRYLQTTLALEVDSQALQTELTAEADAKLYMVKTRDIINDVLRSKTAEEFNDPDMLREIRKEVVFRLNQIFSEGKVREVYITDMVIQ